MSTPMPLANVSRMNTTRTITGSMRKYSAIPPATPNNMRLVLLFCNRLIDSPPLRILWPPRTQGPTHDRTRRLTARHFRESRAVVHPPGAEPHEVGMARSGFVDRIRFQQGGALRTRVVHRRLEHPLGHAAPALLRIDKGAHEGPHGLVVHWFHDRRASQAEVLVPRAERDPGNRPAGPIPDEARDGAAVDQRLHGPLVGLGTPSLVSALAVVHAPAAADDRPAGTAKQLNEVI